jgi:hypothetical protein
LIRLLSTCWYGICLTSRMRTLVRIIPTCVFCLIVAAPAGAQTPAPSVPSDWNERVEELRAWVSAYSEWKSWNEKWRNKVEPGWVGFKERREPPDPPPWLFAECASLIAAEGILGEACDLLVEWNDPADTGVRKRAARQAQSEKVTKTIWWEHVHLDAFWPMPDLRASVYGVIGVHAAVAIAGRFQVFVAPGAILINLPSGGNSREWQPAADWGVAYRLTDFKFPGTEQLASLHFNFAKAWILTGQPGISKADIELAGFSFTFKKDRRK